jgi:hypothetical protein
MREKLRRYRTEISMVSVVVAFVAWRLNLANAYFSLLGSPTAVLAIRSDSVAEMVAEMEVPLPKRAGGNILKIPIAVPGWQFVDVAEPFAGDGPSLSPSEREKIAAREGLSGRIRCQQAAHAAKAIEFPYHCDPIKYDWIAPYATALDYSNKLRVAASFELRSEAGPSFFSVLCRYTRDPLREAFQQASDDANHEVEDRIRERSAKAAPLPPGR